MTGRRQGIAQPRASAPDLSPSHGSGGGSVCAPGTATSPFRGESQFPGPAMSPFRGQSGFPGPVAEPWETHLHVPLRTIYVSHTAVLRKKDLFQ